VSKIKSKETKAKHHSLWGWQALVTARAALMYANVTLVEEGWASHGLDWSYDQKVRHGPWSPNAASILRIN